MGLLASQVPSTTAASPASGGLLAGYKAPISAPLVSSPGNDYFYTKNPDTSTIGAADETDPYSGTPYFAYRTPGTNATTTDYTRTATKFNPETAQPEPYDQVRNTRMPESASEAIRAEEGATSGEQLDHAMALAISGSNNPVNLRLIPTAQNQAAGSNEGALQKDVATGKISLFEAQREEAKNKGIPAPFTDSPAHHASLLDYIENAFRKLPSELAGIHNPF